MPRKRKVQVKCPACKQPVKAGAEDFPFCSPRCRVIDLGKWASGQYVVSSPLPDLGDQLEYPGMRKNEEDE